MSCQRRRPIIIKIVENEDNQCDCCSFSLTTFHPWNCLFQTVLRKKIPLVIKVFRTGQNLPWTGAGPRTGS
jgi:hypothetical protein